MQIKGLVARAQKMLSLQKIERAIVESGDEGFTIQIARAAMPLPAEIKKLCDRYGRTWEESKLYKDTPQTDLIVHNSYDSNLNLMVAWAHKKDTTA